MSRLSCLALAAAVALAAAPAWAETMVEPLADPAGAAEPSRAGPPDHLVIRPEAALTLQLDSNPLRFAAGQADTVGLLSAGVTSLYTLPVGLQLSWQHQLQLVRFAGQPYHNLLLHVGTGFLSQKFGLAPSWALTPYLGGRFVGRVGTAPGGRGFTDWDGFLGVNAGWDLDDSQLLVFGYQLDALLAEASYARSWGHGPRLTYYHVLADHTFLTASYHVQFRLPFNAQGLATSRHALGVGLLWFPLDWLGLELRPQVLYQAGATAGSSFLAWGIGLGLATNFRYEWQEVLF